MDMSAQIRGGTMRARGMISSGVGAWTRREALGAVVSAVAGTRARAVVLPMVGPQPARPVGAHAAGRVPVESGGDPSTRRVGERHDGGAHGGGVGGGAVAAVLAVDAH